MNDLENKLSQEIKPECTVVACRFPFPNWKEIATIGEGVDSVWVYKPGQRIPEMKRGSSIKITLKERPTRKPKWEQLALNTILRYINLSISRLMGRAVKIIFTNIFLNTLQIFIFFLGPSINDVTHFLRFLTPPSRLLPIFLNRPMECCNFLADPPSV